MRKRLIALLAAATLALTACGSDDGGGGADGGGDKAAEKSKFFDQAEYDRQLAFRDIEAEGPGDRPWEQTLEPEMVDTAKYKKPAKYDVCFSNAAVDNPWRQVGWKTMQEEVKLHPEIRQLQGAGRRGQGRQADQRHRVTDLGQV